MKSRANSPTGEIEIAWAEKNMTARSVAHSFSLKSLVTPPLCRSAQFKSAAVALNARARDSLFHTLPPTLRIPHPLQRCLSSSSLTVFGRSRLRSQFALLVSSSLGVRQNRIKNDFLSPPGCVKYNGNVIYWNKKFHKTSCPSESSLACEICLTIFKRQARLPSLSLSLALNLYLCFFSRGTLSRVWFGALCNGFRNRVVA